MEIWALNIALKKQSFFIDSRFHGVVVLGQYSENPKPMKNV